MDASYEEAIGQVTDALKAEDFGVLTRIEVKDTIKQKLDADFRRYVILGACNPHLACRVLQEELEVGLLLPRNGIVYETEENRAVVAVTDPFSLLGITHN